MLCNGACESTVQILRPSPLIFLTSLHCHRQNCGWRGAGFRVCKDPRNTVFLEKITVAKLVKNSTPFIKPEICRVQKKPATGTCLVALASSPYPHTRVVIYFNILLIPNQRLALQSVFLSSN
jgi:hypothetical protein